MSISKKRGAKKSKTTILIHWGWKGKDFNFEVNQRDVAIHEPKEKVEMFIEISTENDRNSQMLARHLVVGILKNGELISQEDE